MTEPSERDLEMAREFIMAGHSPIYEGRIASLLAAVRAEERERIAAMADTMRESCRKRCRDLELGEELCHEGFRYGLDRLAERIRSGQ